MQCGELIIQDEFYTYIFYLALDLSLFLFTQRLSTYFPSLKTTVHNSFIIPNTEVLIRCCISKQKTVLGLLYT